MDYPKYTMYCPFLIAVILGCGCKQGEPLDAPKEQPAALMKTETDNLVMQLASKADLVVLGTIQKVYDRTAKDGGMEYDVLVEKVLKGIWAHDSLRFRSAGWIGYAKYSGGERVLVFLKTYEAQQRELIQLQPVTYVRKEDVHTGEPLYLWPVEKYLELIATLESKPLVPR